MFSASPPAGGTTSHTAFLRRMYNLVYISFFRRHQKDNHDLDGANVGGVYQRPSTLETSFVTHSDDNVTTEGVPTSPSLGSTVDDARQAFAQDRFDKARAY